MIEKSKKRRKARPFLGFWKKQKKPILILAPMANVTDSPFRRVIAARGKPDVFFTEFVSCDGLCSAGRAKLMIDLRFTESERPIVAQFFGAKPDNFKKCAALAAKLGFDGIDINMGCPDRGVEKQGAGAALMKNPELAKQIIIAAKEGAGGLPVSVKTRLGYNKNAVTKWIKTLLEAKPAAIIIHGRTRKEMSKTPADWKAIAKAVKIARGSGTLIIGNGDVQSVADAGKKAARSGVDGVMFGRAVFGNPWLFNENKNPAETPPAEKLAAALEHALLFNKTFRGKKNFAIMKKHFKAYASGFDGAKEIRIKLMAAENFSKARAILKQFLKKYENEKHFR